MRGEHSCRRRLYWACAGSAPRARGTPPSFGIRLVGVGISPACAGNTATCRKSSAIRRDQPRVRGEHSLLFPSFYEKLGSAPRARGTLTGEWFSETATGISPACAGNTSVRRAVAALTRDQPRVRGEHTLIIVKYQRFEKTTTSFSFSYFLLKRRARRYRLALLQPFRWNPDEALSSASPSGKGRFISSSPS